MQEFPSDFSIEGFSLISGKVQAVERADWRQSLVTVVLHRRTRGIRDTIWMFPAQLSVESRVQLMWELLQNGFIIWMQVGETTWKKYTPLLTDDIANKTFKMTWYFFFMLELSLSSVVT